MLQMMHVFGVTLSKMWLYIIGVLKQQQCLEDAIETVNSQHLV